MKKNKNHITPPRLAEKLLLWFLKDELAEEVLGDLEEKFLLTLECYSARKARRNYWLQVLNYLRPFALKKRKPKYNNTAMFKHNLLISYRSFMRFKSTFFINLTGLASGLACALLIYLWVNDELSIDRFHEKGDRIYQVIQHNQWQTEVETYEHTQRLLASSLLEDFPEVEKAISVNDDWAESPGIVGFGETKLKAKDNQIDPDFFNIFSYKLLQGNTDLPIPNTSSVLISDQLALKLFNNLSDVVGKTISWQQEEMSGDYIISGVFEAPPKASSKQFDLLFSMELLVERHDGYLNWLSNNERTYLLMKEGADMQAFSAKIEDYLKTKTKGAKNTLTIQLYGDRYLYGNYVNAVQSGGRIVYVRLFSAVALFILGIACINFMNLTTAKASNRMKEIGIKKAIGARRKSLMYQYFSESLLLSFMALIGALVLVFLFLPQFNLITGKQLSLTFNSNLILGALSIALTTGLLSGSYPALYLSGLHPIAMLKGKLQQTFGDTWLRKGLVIFQFTVSSILIAAVMVVSQQIDYIQSKNLGFNRNNLLRFDYVTEDGPGYRAFLQELKSIPQIVNVAGAVDDATGVHGGTLWVRWPGKEPDSQVDFEILEVSYDFLETMDIKLAQGRTYDREIDKPGRSRMIFNETAIAAMGLKDPIGKVVEVQGERSEIIGVVKDFHFQSMYNVIRPLYIQLADELEYTLVRMQAGSEFETISAIEKIYNDHLPGVPFEFTFVDQDFASMYQAERSISTLSKYFAGIAVIISCLGLLGLTAFTAERRTKEIGIRKVLGAGLWHIVYLLSSSFTGLVIVAIMIALPLSYFVASGWLESFAFSIDLNIWYFIMAGVLMLLFSWLVAGIQTMKAANANPVESLRTE